MAINLNKGSTIVSVVTESTEGTAANESAGTDFVQVNDVEITPAKDLIERDTLSNSIGKVTPRVSQQSVSGSLNLEYKGSGTEGVAPEYSPLISSMLGNVYAQASRVTSGTTHTTSVINATAHPYSVGEMIVILDSGDHSYHFISAVTTNDFTYTPVRGSAPADAVEISKAVTYYPANSGQASTTIRSYWADTKKQSAVGCKIASMSLENFSTGQVPTLNFGFEGLSFTEVSGSAAYAPSYDTGLPPLVLGAYISQGDTCIELNEFAFSLENTVSPLPSVCSSTGKLSSSYTERKISGSYNPYLDDTSTTYADQFDANTAYSLVVFVANDSSTTGEYDLGSVVGFYFPSCITTERSVGEQDGILVENITFNANRGESGSTEEIYMGFV